MQFPATLGLPASLITLCLLIQGCGSDAQPQAADQDRPPPTIVLRSGDDTERADPRPNASQTAAPAPADHPSDTQPTPPAIPDPGSGDDAPSADSTLPDTPEPDAPAGTPAPPEVAPDPAPQPIERVEGPIATGARGTYYLAEVARSRNIAQRTESANRLRNLAIALQGFEIEFNRYPRSLEELLDHNPAMSAHLVSPADRDTRFVYLAPSGNRPTGAAILAYDPTLYPGETINVLTGAGTIERMSRDDLEAALERQQPQTN